MSCDGEKDLGVGVIEGRFRGGGGEELGFPHGLGWAGEGVGFWVSGANVGD